MKKKLSVLFIVLLLCNNSYAKDLTGTIIYCENWRNKAFSFRKNPEAWKYTTFEFITSLSVDVISIRKFKLEEYRYDYKVELQKIIMESYKIRYSIDRKKLTLNDDKRCKIIKNENFKPKEIMKKNLDKVITKQKQLNKI